MKKLSNVFLLIGEILMIVDMVSCFLAAVTIFIMAAPFATEPVRDAIIASAGESLPVAELDLIISSYQISMIVSGAITALSIIPMGFAASFAHKTRNDGSGNNIVATLVFAYLCGANIMLAGAILGLISHLKENRE